MKFTNCHCHSDYSLLDGAAKCSKIAKRCAELGYTSCALTDHGSISGAVSFIKACKEYNIKPIIGIEAYVTESSATIKDKKNIVAHQIILAKNLQGWKNLIQLVSRSNDVENFYYKPRIDLEMMQRYCDNNMISFSGHPVSTIDRRLDNMDDVINYVELMKDIFGKNNFFIEVQSVDPTNFDDIPVLVNKLRELARLTNTQPIATGDTHYVLKSDAQDQRVLLCSSMQLTLKQVQNSPDITLNSFFKTDCYHIPSIDDLVEWGNTEEEIENTQIISDMCESYDISSPPRLPKFDCPNNLSEIEYLKHLCRNEWKKKSKEDWDKSVYGDRVKREIEVIENAHLAGYFLIVQDYVNWAKNQGWLVGPGRGSAGGSLVAYLLNITNVDPIKHNLIFERFINPGRLTEGKTSLPDIDIDFPITKRQLVINYIRNKYGHNRVCQMATFGRLQGRGALKEVLRIHDVFDFETMNQITKNIPQEHEIDDQLKETGETSILRWTLENDPNAFGDWCRLNENGEIAGEIAQYVQQAIRIEGVFKSQGKHAAGIVVSVDDLNLVCPMIRDKNSDEKIAGMDMNDLEYMGHLKLDILGVAALDKLQAVNNLLQYGRIYSGT